MCRFGLVLWCFNSTFNNISVSSWWISVIFTHFLTLCDKVCQWLTTGQWFSQGTPVSCTNKTDGHYIMKYCWMWHFNTINPTLFHSLMSYVYIPELMRTFSLFLTYNLDTTVHWSITVISVPPIQKGLG
jgi:hypothetical protein